MALPRCLQVLHRSGWEFWLSLPFIAILFWLISAPITATVLSRPYHSVNKLQTDTQLDVKLSATVLAINATLYPDRNFTMILVKTTGSTLKKLEYEFPTTQTSQVEMELAQELGLSIDRVRKMVSYRIKD